MPLASLTLDSIRPHSHFVPIRAIPFTGKGMTQPRPVPRSVGEVRRDCVRFTLYCGLETNADTVCVPSSS